MRRRLKRWSNFKIEVFIYSNEEDTSRIFLFYFNKICKLFLRKVFYTSFYFRKHTFKKYKAQNAKTRHFWYHVVGFRHTYASDSFRIWWKHLENLKAQEFFFFYLFIYFFWRTNIVTSESSKWWFELDLLRNI